MANGSASLKRSIDSKLRGCDVVALLMAHDRAEGNVLPLTQEFISMMLAVRRSGVTIAARSLQRTDAIEYQNGRITVPRPPAARGGVLRVLRHRPGAVSTRTGLGTGAGARWCMTLQRPSDDDVAEFEDVFMAFVTEHRQPSFEALCAYLQRHPRHACALIEFAVEWAVLADLQPQGGEEERAAERMAEEALAQLHALFSPVGSQTSPAAWDQTSPAAWDKSDN